MKFYKAILQPVFRFLNPGDRARGIWIIALMVLNAALDFFSLASFLPLIFIIVNPDSVHSNKYLNSIYSVFNFQSPSWFIISFIAFVLVFTIVKNVAAQSIARAKANYCFNLGSEFSSRMLSRYIEVSYLKFVQLDFTKELNRIANLPVAFANNIILPLANLLSEGLVFIILLAFITYYDFKVFLLLVVILVPVRLVYSLRKKSLSQTSDDLKEKYPLTLKYALQVVEGLMDIRAFSKETFFKDRFNESSKSLAKTFVRDHLNQTNATRLMEIITAFIICSIIAYSIITSQDYQHTFLLLGIYAGVSFRMIPSINRILNALTQIKSHEYLFKELAGLASFKEEKNIATAPHLIFVRAIEMKNISFQFPEGARILHNASLTIRKGDKIALTGKSGSGKTTVILLLLRFLKGDAGKILLDDAEVQGENSKAWRRIFGYVPQNPYILDGTMAENIAFGFSAEEIDHEKIQQLIQTLDLQEMVSQHPGGLATQIGEKGIKLSGGQRQRIAIARALYADAEILLLDEITNQLDIQTEQEIIKTLKKIAHQEKTVLMITHHEHLLNEFDRVVSLEDGVFLERRSESISSR